MDLFGVNAPFCWSRTTMILYILLGMMARRIWIDPLPNEVYRILGGGG